jgi:hypothetical protein
MSSFVTFGSRRISLGERSCLSFALFVSLLYVGFSLSLSLSFGDVVGGRQWEVQALSAGARYWCRVSKKVFVSRAR